ncbi:MAG: 4'-phosphopantetheinyl transferase superfamily protein [Rhodobacteraceae bacterium]|nr:4'-phosphopantetheinyl transferase superfamily protein [Paracoccaceae bacterium]
MTISDFGDVQWWRPHASCAGVEILHVDLSPNESHDQAALAWLDCTEYQRWQRFRVERARRQFSRCRAALRMCLCERLGCRNDRLAFGAGKYGKPFAMIDGRASEAAFNVSHSHEHGLIAFGTDGVRLGVDVETRRARDTLRLASESVFGKCERDALAGLSGWDWYVLFFRLWTVKEALIKALGTGFSLNPRKFEVPQGVLEGDSSSRFRFPHLPDNQWLVADLGDRRFAASLALETEADDDAKPEITFPLHEDTPRFIA